MLHKTINNAYARSPCAYCNLHKCSLTVRQIKMKECLKKECWHLKKYEHEWWKQRAALKEKKKLMNKKETPWMK